MKIFAAAYCMHELVAGRRSMPKLAVSQVRRVDLQQTGASLKD